MTQTQDEQNVQASWAQTQGSTQDEQNVQASWTQTQSSTQDEQNVQTNEQSITENEWIQAAETIVTNTLDTGVKKAQWIWEAGIEWVKSAASQWIESAKSTLKEWWELLKETSQNAIEWIKGAWQDLKEGIWDIVTWVTSGEWILESWKAVVQWTFSTTTNVVWNVATNVVNTWENVVNWAIWAVTNIATWAGNVVKDSINNVAWIILPEQWARTVKDIQNKISQWAENLTTQTREKLQEWWEQASGLFGGLINKVKGFFSNKNAQKIMDEANAPINTTPQVQQPAEVQPGDIQQPTSTN